MGDKDPNKGGNDPGKDPGSQDPGKDPGTDPGASQDPGTGGNEPGGNSPGAGAPLSKEDIQTIVKDSISAAIKDVVTPELDRRISGATKTIYKKVGIQDDDPGQKDPGAKADDQAAALKQRREIIQVHADTALKEEVGKLDEEVQKVADRLMASEISNLDLSDENLSNRDLGQKAATEVAKMMKTTIEKVEKAKVEALRKAGQVLDIGTGEQKKTEEDLYKEGKELAEKRHQKKK